MAEEVSRTDKDAEELRAELEEAAKKISQMEDVEGMLTRAAQERELEKAEAEAAKERRKAERAAELAEKRRKAKVMNSYSPAVISRGNGEVKTFTDEDIDAMSSTDCDAVIASILRRRSVGARAAYPDLPSLEKKISEYWQNVATQRAQGYDIIPDIEHFCSFLGVSRQTVLKWKRDNANGFAEPLEMAFNDIAAVKNQLALHGDINSMVWMAMMNNNHGYTQNNKLEVTATKAGGDIPTAESLISEIHQLMSED